MFCLTSKVRTIQNISINSRYNSNSYIDYCLDSMRQNDYENFVCTLLLKNKARSCAISVHSLNIEFWDDMIDKCFISKDPKSVPQHPVAQLVLQSVMHHKLTKYHFKNLISIRKLYLNKNYFETLEDLEIYAEKSVSSLYYLILEGKNIRNLHVDHAASHLGKAQGIVHQLRTIPYSRQINMISVPQDLLIKHKLSEEAVLRGNSSEKLQECVYEIACRAYQHLSKARNLMEKIPIVGRDVFLPAVPVSSYLDSLQKDNYEIMHPKLQRNTRKWLFNLWLSHLRKKF